MAYNPQELPDTWQEIVSSVPENQTATGKTLVSHPSRFGGFSRLSVAEPRGQIADYALSLHNGSRLHVHILREGIRTFKFRYHIDRWDPDHSLSYKIKHLAAETYAARTIAAIAAIVYLGIG